MYKSKSIIGIIPARSGSKGLPHKNIRLFAGRPLLAWTILAAQKSSIVDEVFVSTDDARYAETAAQYGANVPFLRPPELSGDKCAAAEYLVHAISEYRDRLRRAFDYFVLLQPTNPLRTPEHIADGIRMAIDENLPSVVSFSLFKGDLRLIYKLPEDNALSALQSPISHSRAASPNDVLRQDAERVYKVNGLLYVAECDAYIKSRSFYMPGGKAMITDGAYDVDIDDEAGFLYAEYLAKRSGSFG